MQPIPILIPTPLLPHPIQCTILAPISSKSSLTIIISQNKILALKDRIILYTALHSYSQLILFPWGYDSKKIPEDYTELETVARKASIEIKKTHGKQYRYGSSSNVLYSSSGGADDWVKGEALFFGIQYYWINTLN